MHTTLLHGTHTCKAALINIINYRYRSEVDIVRWWRQRGGSVVSAAASQCIGSKFGSLRVHLGKLKVLFICVPFV